MARDPSMKSDKTPGWFERWCRRAKMRPVCKIEDKDGAVLIADSGMMLNEDGNYFYRTGYAIERNGVQLGAFNNYDPIEFFRDGPLIGQQRRVNEALAAARRLKNQLNKADFWPGVTHG